MPAEPYDIKEEEICAMQERYLAFIDETGDPYIHKDRVRYVDPTVFPVLTVSALVVSTTVYKEVLRPAIDDIKMRFWGTRDVHFHSNEIRRKDGIFKVLIDPLKYEEFKELMVAALEKSSVTLISSSINKMKLLDKAERFKQNTGNEYNPGDLYLTNVGWVLERIGHFIKKDTARIVFETRGRQESRRIQGVLTIARQQGTFYHNKDRFKNICEEILFFTKKENVNGVQMVDYCTYPFARHAKNGADDNKLFDLLRPFVYQGDFGEYGLKEWP
jgi:hypothetical protein